MLAILALAAWAMHAAPVHGAEPTDGGTAASAQTAPARTIPAGTIQFKLVVSDLDRSGAFYRSVLQATQAMRFTSSMNRRAMEEILLARPDGELLTLVLIRFLDRRAPTHTQAVTVFFTDDIDAFVERVVRGGGKVTERRDDPEHGARIAFWYDPEGNLAETVQLR